MTLFESLVALFLVTVIGLGLSYAAINVAVAQKTMNAQNLTLAQMRSIALNKTSGSALCPGTAASGVLASQSLSANVSVDIRYQCSQSAVTVSASGVTATVTASMPALVLSASAPTLLGTGSLAVGN